MNTVFMSTERSLMSAVREQRRAGLDAPRPDTRAAILSALEQILADTALHEVSVAQILEGAGVSRGAFYSYFESKFEAAGALLAQVMDDIYEEFRPFVDLDPEADPRETLRDVLRPSIGMWTEHGAIARTTHQYWYSVPELGRQWSAAMERFTAGVASAIDRAREAAVVPPGDDSRKIAAAGLWASEQLAFVVSTGSSADLPDLESTSESALNMWIGLLFGGPTGGSA